MTPSDADLIAAGAKRVERVGDAVLILGDCREIAPRLPRPDAIVSDPPYGIGYQHSGGGNGAHSGRKFGLHARNGNSPIVGDDEPFDPALWVDGAENVLLWGANHFAQRVPHGRWLAWNKLGGLEPFGDSFSDVEFAWHNKRGAERIFSHLWKGLCQAGAGVKREHPTQKPVQLLEWCLEQVKAQRGALCLDPYMGSGTTGVACLRRGVRFIGIEIEPRYFDVACRRIAEAARQPSLFDAAPAPKPQQLDMSYPVERMA